MDQIKSGVNSLVCGGNRRQRKQIIQLCALGYQGDRFLELHAKPGIDDRLEELGNLGEDLLIAFYDTNLIPERLLWRIRSVAQDQRNVVYVFEGAHRKKMLDLVIDYDAAFYRQLTVVDLHPPRQFAVPAATHRGPSKGGM